jgi:hypothetical protein
MPPSGGMIVSALQFSTTRVDAFGKSLWKTHIADFAINHLARSDEFLRT